MFGFHSGQAEAPKIMAKKVKTFNLLFFTYYCKSLFYEQFSMYILINFLYSLVL